MPISSPRKNKTGKTKKKTAKKIRGKKAATKKAAAKKPAKELDDVEAWVARMQKSSKHKGTTQVRMASETKNPYGLRRPTGKLGLDIGLGGGLHAGGVIEVQGPESVGKTLFYWDAIGQLQQVYGKDTKVLVAATELRPDKDQARMAGCCIAYSNEEIDDLEGNRVLHNHPKFTAEERKDLKKQIGKIVIVMAATAETLFDAIFDAMKENIFQMVVIDSMGALLPKAKDNTDSFQEKTYGGASVPVTDFMNKLYPLFIMDRGDGSMAETTLLAINQARARIGATKYERNTKEAMGAYAWKHGQLVNILLTRGAKIRETKKGPAVGYTVNWELVKGKMGTHDGKKGTYDYYHLPKMQPVFWKDVEETWFGGVAYYNEHVETAQELGVVEGVSWPAFTKSNGEVLKAQGVDNLAQLFAEDPEAFEELRDACFEKAGVSVRHK